MKPTDKQFQGVLYHAQCFLGVTDHSWAIVISIIAGYDIVVN